MATINSINSNIPIEIEKGGTAATSLTDHGLLVGSGTGAVTALAVGADNSVLIGSTGADPAFTTSGNMQVNSISFDTGTNSLNFYEEAEFTPTAVGETTAGSTTYSQRGGYYTRIGDTVFAHLFIFIDSVTGTGNVLVGGLPYTIKNQTNGIPIGDVNGSFTGWGWPASTTTLIGEGIPNTTTARIAAFGNGVAKSYLQINSASNDYFRFRLIYQV